MLKRNIVFAVAVLGSLTAVQGALAAQPAGLGYDPYYVFGASRMGDTKSHVAQSTTNAFGFDPYYVLGTVGDTKETKASSMWTVEQRTNPFGEQAGA